MTLFARARTAPAWAWLAAIVVASAAFRIVLARQMVAPWIMVDELIYSELAKSFAASGHFLVRGVPSHGYGFVYPVLIAPAFRLFSSVPQAYTAAKAIDSVLMSLAAVPAYLLARRVVRPGLALVVAVLTVAVPSMVYTGTLMTENAFYPLFLTCALVLVLVLERPTVLRVAALLALSLLAFLTRAQAVALVPAILTAPLLLPRARWREFRLLYGVLLGAGLVVLGYEVARGNSPLAALGAYRAATGSSYSAATVLRWLVYHLGELDLYVGVAPFAALGFLAFTKERSRPFVAAALPLTGWLVLEVAAFASTQSQRIEERNMFFVAPLFFVALALWIERGLPRPRAASASALVAAALVGVVPFSGLLNGNATSDTLAFLPLWTLQDTITTLDEIGAVAVGVAIAFALLFLLVPVRYALALPAALLALYAVALWPIEANPHGGIHHASLGALFGGTSKPDREWIDHAVGPSADVAVLYDSPTMDKFTVWTNEFFNRSVRQVAYTTDPTPGGLPEAHARIGRDGYVQGLGQPRYVLTTLPLIGQAVARDRIKNLTVWRIERRVRLAYRTEGVYADGWTGAHASIERFACPGSTTIHLRQGKLFPQPQIVLVNGRSYRIAGTRAIQVRSCSATIDVPVTRIPGPADTRQLGIIVDGFTS
ncbi:MAG TPA: glycosyltransferase family 39 protein [Gaiellaceae bacterium]|nr:glycosyltransferase family 39 protein [Gaiellaceae bacterium]